MTDLQGQMEVVGHQAKSVDAVVETFDALLQQQKESRSIPVIHKDVLPAIATKHYVVSGARIV